MTHRCNDWECPYNKNGECHEDECQLFDIFETLQQMKGANTNDRTHQEI